MPEQIQQIEAILATPFSAVKVPLEAVMVVKENQWKIATDPGGNITGLNLARTGLTSKKWKQILAAFPTLPDTLQVLNLCENDLTEMDFSGGFNNLRELNLAENKRLAKIAFANAHPKLTFFDASECALTALELPAMFLQKPENPHLQPRLGIFLQKNQLQTFRFLDECSALEVLDLSENKLTNFHLPEGFHGLEHLFLQKNELQKFGFGGRVPALHNLHLRGNQLTEFDSQELSRAPNLKTLFLHGNPLREIPTEMLGGENSNCLPDLKSFFRSFQKSDQEFLRQAKLVLVGNGEVGKSSIRLKLLDKSAPLPTENDRTPGLEIAPYTVPNLPPALTNLLQKIDFQLNIWDFGGQGKYREVQQLFCTRKTMYLFVTAIDDTAAQKKEDYIGFEYWLSMVNAYSFDNNDSKHSPVIYVVNKIDKGEAAVNEVDCRDQFGNVVGFVKISCETLKNFDLLEAKIRETLPDVSRDIFTDGFSEFWMNVKRELERRQPENHIAWAEYLKICTENGLDESEAVSWIRVLDRIGTVIYFGKHPNLENWIVLNPKWVNRAFCQLIDSKSAVGGTLKPTDFEVIWDEKNYDADERRHLQKLLLAYELAYERRDGLGNPQFVVPCLLPQTVLQLPDILQKPDFKLKLEFKPFVPAGTVNKLMVRFNSLIFNGLMWQNNAVFFDPEGNTYAHVREDWQAKSIFVELTGGQSSQFFEKIERELGAITQNLKDTRFVKNLGFESWGEKNGRWRTLADWQEIGQPFFPSKKAVEGTPIFFSYAWGDAKETTAESREKIVDELYDALKNSGFDIRRDKKDLNYGELISKFMDEIAGGELIVIFISDKYVRSPYCMYELLEIAQNCKFKKEIFAQRVLPIPVEFLAFDKPKTLNEYFDFWEEEEKEWRKIRERRQATIEQDKHYQFTKKVNDNFGQLVDWLVDMNQSTTKLLRDDDFELVKQTILTRLKQTQNP